VAEGSEYVLCEGQLETDNLRYEIIHDGTKKNKSAGDQGNITRNVFCSMGKRKNKLRLSVAHVELTVIILIKNKTSAN